MAATVVRDEYGTPISTYDNYKDGYGKGSVKATKAGIGLQGRVPAGISDYINPPAHPKLNSILAKTNSPLQQGLIQQLDDSVVAPQRYPYACRFMFNPTVLEVNYEVDESRITPGELTPDQAAAVAIGAGKTTLSFSLLFDRTYDVAYGPTTGQSRDLRNIGMYADVAALEHMTGARYAWAATPKEVIRSMTLVPCYFVFGGGNGNSGLSFIGAITSMRVTYSMFSENMVPIRGGVDIGVTQYLGVDLTQFLRKGGGLTNRMAQLQNRNIPQFA